MRSSTDCLFSRLWIPENPTGNCRVLVDAKSVWLQAEERAVCIAGGILDRSVRAMRVNSPLLPRPHGIRQLAAKRESGDFSAGMALDHVEIFDIC